MDPFAVNPFSALTFIAAPAILTNASSVMGMSTSNRIARVVDRTRVLTTLIEKDKESGDPNLPIHLFELSVGGRRAQLLVRALTAFYTSVGSFAASSLVSLMGMVCVMSGLTLLSRVAIGVGLCCGTVALCGLIYGAALLVLETRLALSSLNRITQHLREHLPVQYQGPVQPPA